MAKYKDAISWIAANTDTEWLGEYEIMPCDSTKLVSDLFEKPMEIVLRDLIRAVVADDDLNSGNG